MFKAKLIEDNAYYGYRKTRLLFYFLPAFPIGILINYYQFETWSVGLAILLYVAIVWFAIRNTKRIQSLSDNRQIELDDNMVRVKSNTQLPAVEIDLNGVDKIGISRDYGIPEESFKDIANELAGQAKRNFIEITTDQHKQRFDFIIESYYMLGHFEKQIKKWDSKGYSIEKI